jgi:tripartite-type tricarboxylate transporter receptor subunit TctC
MKTRTFLASLAAGLVAAALRPAAQAWPSRPVKVIIPFPPGGTLDAVGRQLAQKLGEQMGQPFVVENRPGGNGTIGAHVVARRLPTATPCSSMPPLSPPRP